MKVERLTLPIEPRSLSGCLDLAVQFNRAWFRPLAGLLGEVAVPALALTVGLSLVTDRGLLYGLLVYFVLSPLLGSLIVAGAGQHVFGDPFEVGRALRLFGSHAWRLSFHLLVSRVVIGLGSLLVVVGLLLVPRYGFLPEVVLLERLRGPRLRQRLSELRRGVASSLEWSVVVIGGFQLVLTIATFVLVDLACGYLLGLPILINRDPGVTRVGDVLDRLLWDPLPVTVLCGLLWASYPLARLAWFFGYLDQRIRNECWDVELEFRREARRIAGRTDR
jgi:hypothetical protein